MKTISIVSIIFLPILLLMSCDLLNAPTDPDYFEKIDAEIAWANAAVFTVTVNYPPDWGVSSQRGIGRAGDTREGYAFELDFVPNSEFVFVEWRAYRTADLTPDWLEYPELYFSLGNAKPYEGISLPQGIGENGGLGTFTVHSAADITLIPFSRGQPRLQRTSPVLSRTPENAPEISRASDILLSFASNLDREPSTLSVGASNSITIMMYDFDGTNGVDASGSFVLATSPNDRILLRPKQDNLPPEDKLMELTLGTSIATSGWGHSYTEAQIFYWTTRGGECSIKDWEAECLPNGNISLNWNYDASLPTLSRVSARLEYKINGSTQTSIPISTGTRSHTFTNVFTYDRATPASARHYEIDIVILLEDKVIRMEVPVNIWNVRGMRILHDDDVHIIGNASELDQSMKLNNNKVVQVLDRDFVYSTQTWPPVDIVFDAGNSYTGRFYGMGRSITFSQGFRPGRQFNGFLGRASGSGRVQDLTIHYSSSTVLTGATDGINYVGGLAGQVVGSFTIIGCHVSGASGISLTHNMTGGQRVNMGGMVGSLETNVAGNFTQNSAFINLISTSNGEESSIGGLVGYSSTWDINQSWARGNVSVNSGNNIRIYAGGLVGWFDASGRTITNCYSRVDLLVQNPNNNHSDILLGGLVGRLHGRITHSFAAGGQTGYIRYRSTSLNNSSNPFAYASGIASRRSTDTAVIHNTVARMNEISLTSSSTTTASNVLFHYRIAWAATAGLQNNLALSTMNLGRAVAGGSGGIPGNPTLSSAVSPSGPDTQNGDSRADTAVSGALRNSETWTGAGLTLGFNTTYWDMSTIAARGYPILLNTLGNQGL